MTDVEAFEAHRTHLTSIAYRMLGEMSAAEDVVQEAWLRWSRADSVEIRDARVAVGGHGAACTRCAAQIAGAARKLCGAVAAGTATARRYARLCGRCAGCSRRARVRSVARAA